MKLVVPLSLIRGGGTPVQKNDVHPFAARLLDKIRGVTYTL